MAHTILSYGQISSILKSTGIEISKADLDHLLNDTQRTPLFTFDNNKHSINPMKQRIFNRRHLVTIDMIGFNNDKEAKKTFYQCRSNYVHPLNGTTRTIYRSIPNGLRIYVFDLYVLKKLSIIKKCKCYLRNLFTTTFRKMGIQ